MDRSRDRGVEERLEVDAVQISPALDGGAAVGTLPDLCLGELDGPGKEGERVGDQPGSRLQQAPTSVERGLEDLLLERFVADDLGDQQVGLLRQLDLPRPAGEEGHSVLDTVDLEDPLGDGGDVRGLDRVDPSGARSGRRHGEDPTPGADVEHDVTRADRGGQRRQVVTGPAVVVEHAGVLHRVGPAAGAELGPRPAPRGRSPR